ncbi:MAG: nucleotidyltransferase family protein [Bacillota bacterium]|nr:nucleotidyltransferase family protein [Bacillota bacterium]
MIDGVNAVVLAGDGGFQDPSAPAGELAGKALLPIGSRFMVDYVVTALKNCAEVRKIVLVGPEALYPFYGEESGLLFAAPGSSPLESFAAGVAALDEENETPWVLACTGDVPFLTPAAVADFLDRCREREAGLYYPIIPREVAEKRFPGVKRTYARLREGTFTGGNLFLLDRRILQSCLPKAEEFVRLRKNPAALARLVGFEILGKYLFGILSVKEIERRVSELFGVQGAAVISHYPEIGVDVDKPADLALARNLLAPSET